MSTRRALLAATATVLVVGANGAPSPVPHPDAALLAVCAQLVAMQAEWQRLYDATSDNDELTTAADFAWQAYNDDVWPGTGFQPRDCDTVDVPAKLLTLRATTPEGMQAKAAAILAMDDAGDYTHDIRDDSFELMLSLIEDVAGLARRPLGADVPATPLRQSATA